LHFSLDHDIIIVPLLLGHNRSTYTLTKMQNQPCRVCSNLHNLWHLTSYISCCISRAQWVIWVMSSLAVITTTVAHTKG